MGNNSYNSIEANDYNAYYRLSKKASSYFNETGKWSKFLAILGFSLIAILLVFGFFSSVVFSILNIENPQLPFSGIFFVLLYLFFGVIYFIPLFYLFKFSVKIKRSLKKK